MTTSPWLLCPCGQEFSDSGVFMAHDCKPADNSVCVTTEVEPNFRDKVIFSLISACINPEEMSEIINSGSVNLVASAFVNFANAIAKARYESDVLKVEIKTNEL